MPGKKIPMRMCVGCREMRPKKELLRIVRTPEEEIRVDKTGKASGRGAYICPKAECLEKAQKIRALERALEQDKPHWSYVRAILRSYKQQGYTSVAQAREEQQRHRQSYGRDNYGFRGRNVQASCQGYEPADMEKLKKMYDLI